ncbi:MAG: Si-specific NAD(P)(+) transhydrogenase [Gemmatimonadaceae bacterium]
MAAPRYDLAVIGSGPAGQRGAIAAAKLRKNAVIIDRLHMTGGVCVQTGTIPSKTMREAILYLSGFRQRTFYGKDYRAKDIISAADLSSRVQAVVDRETEVIRSQLRRNNVATVTGTARFTAPNTLEVDTEVGAHVVEADKFLIACGTRSAVTPSIPLDGVRIFSSEQILGITSIPRELMVVGAGVIGLEYASMFAALGTKVTVIDQRPTLLDFIDRELIDALSYHMRKQNAIFRLGETVSSVSVNDDGRVVALLESGKTVHGEMLLYTVGRQANSDTLNLEAAGISADSRGRVTVNASFQTAAPHIYAAGDVIGFPSLASSSAEQGRLATGHMFGQKTYAMPALLPYGIYTIPEMSTVGMTEQQLTADKVPYEVGVAKYEELAKGQILGDETGLLKLLFDPSSLKLLGVHVIGEGAAEIVHIGQAVMALGGTIEYFRDTVFNYPTLAEAYKVAALAGLNRLM